MRSYWGLSPLVTNHCILMQLNLTVNLLGAAGHASVQPHHRVLQPRQLLPDDHRHTGEGQWLCLRNRTGEWLSFLQYFLQKNTLLWTSACPFMLMNPSGRRDFEMKQTSISSFFRPAQWRTFLDRTSACTRGRGRPFNQGTTCFPEAPRAKNRLDCCDLCAIFWSVSLHECICIL